MNQLRELVCKKKKKTTNLSNFAHCAVVQVLVQAEGGRKPGQVHVLLVEVLAYAVFCLQEVVAEGNCLRTCIKEVLKVFFLNYLLIPVRGLTGRSRRNYMLYMSAQVCLSLCNLLITV